MLERTIKLVLVQTARALPWGGRRALLDALLNKEGRDNCFWRLADETGVAGVIADGDAGFLAGPPSSHIVLDRYAKRGRWASTTTRLFADFFAATEGRGTFLDIGAHIGAIFIPVALSGSMTCYGFEPTPSTFRFPRANVAMAGLGERCVLHNIALFDRKGAIRFGISPYNDGDNRLFGESGGEIGQFGEDVWNTIEVPTAKLDHLLDTNRLESPIAAKIDTQGGEPFVISGGTYLLARAGLLSIEFAPYWLRRLQGNIPALIEFLRANFQEGDVVEGESEDSPNWRRIADIAERLLTLAEDQNIGLRYFDVIVRK